MPAFGERAIFQRSRPGWADVSIDRLFPSASMRTYRERRAVAEFARRVNALGDLRAASVQNRLEVLDALRGLAPAVDTVACVAPTNRYGRRVLREDRASWSLAAITLRNGQQTEAHDHDGWGAVVTVQGIERDRRYRLDETGELRLIAERDYQPGTGYLFDPTDIHQPAGADSRRLTIALHLLVRDHGAGQHRHEGDGS
jgi:predicted metal-dependent enzyme (double-stranded beta helix superfamily)